MSDHLYQLVLLSPYYCGHVLKVWKRTDIFGADVFSRLDVFYFSEKVRVFH